MSFSLTGSLRDAAAPIAILSLTVLGWRWWKLYRQLPYAPGPPTKIIIGNISDIPAEKPFLRYTEWSKEYGDVVHLRFFHQHMIIISSVEAATELLEKRSNIYSDRPKAIMANMMGWSFNTGFKPYGDTWRQQRRIFQQSFKPDASLSFRPIQVNKVNDMLYGLLTSPDDFSAHFATLTAAVIMAAVYGHDIQPKNDYYVDLVEAAVAKLSESAKVPGAFAVNGIPALRYLPAWFPGAEFKRFALNARELTEKMLNVPMELVKTNMERGTVNPCLVSELLDNCKSDVEFTNIKEVSATSYAAGADTTISALGTFFYAMAKFPEAQKKAQQEIDTALGSDRLPTYDDRPSLPYVEALLREVLRWRPVTPLGVPHSLSDDDVYNGFLMPKGSIVLANLWAMAHNPDVYLQPEEFNPSRFFDEHGDLNDDEVAYAFGFGRRVCPGRHFAIATVWLAVATILASFDIKKKKDASGNEIPIDTDFTDGFIIHPLPYECAITPRLDTAKQLILDAVANKVQNI